ncbi:hypothetical protein NKH85_04935 [Mesorhizobium sp. M0924]|uniref:hypothetical protein n=1 Tax=unclassified Mesorhizobium TaxID=325217 RepID=UPI00333C5036
MTRLSIHDSVVQRRTAIEQDRYYFSPAVEDAWKLADQFSYISADAYILPLDAIAGFTVNVEDAAKSKVEAD